MLGSLISGARDVRVPLAVGLTLVAACWFYFGPLFPSESDATGFAEFLYRTTSLSGPSATIAGGLFVAYLLGSLAVRLGSALLSSIEHRSRFLASTIYGHLNKPAWVTRWLSNYINGGTLFQRFFGRNRIAFYDSTQPLVVDVLREADEDSLRALVLEAIPGWGNEMGIYEEQDLSKLSGDAMREVLATVYTHKVSQEVIGLATRLQINNKDLFDNYDRNLAEGALRVSIAAPVFLLAVSLGLQWSPWFFLIAIASPVLWIHGRELQAQASSVLSEALAERVMTSPALDDLRVRINRDRWSKENQL